MIQNQRIIISCSNAGSLINFRGKLIETLLHKNKVFVITPVIEEKIIRENLTNMGVEIFETSLKRNSISLFFDFKYIFQLFKIINKIKPDLFFAYTFKPIIFGILVASLSGVKNINGMLTGLGYSFTDSARGISKFIIHKMLRYGLRFNHEVKVIFQNKDDYKELLDRKIISPRTKAFVVNGSGVDLSQYEYSIPDVSNITFIMMSRLIKSKGVHEYFEAASLVKQKFPHIKFILAGGYAKGETDSIDHELFESITSGSIVDYRGWVTDIRSLIKESTVVVLPSFYREGIPRSLIEALAMGRPIITTDMIGCRETISQEVGKENGFTIPLQDSFSLARKMEYFILHPKQIIEMGKNGRELAEDKFDVAKVNKQMIEIFSVT